MGLTEIQKEMIRGIATNNMLKARQGALGALNEDTTQKNKNFVARYKSILTSEHGFLYELPAEFEKIVPQVFPTTAPGNFPWLPDMGNQDIMYQNSKWS